MVILGGRPPDQRLKPTLLWAAFSIFVFTAWTNLELGGPAVTKAFDDLALLGAAAVTAVSCFSRGRRTPGRDRSAWTFLGLSYLSWVAGQGVWVLYQDVLGRATPFPSPGDLGFVLAIPLAGWGVLRFAHMPTTASRLRTILDGFLIAASFACLSWFSALQTTWHADYDGTLAKSLALAYPGGTAVVACLVIAVFARCRREQFSLLLVGSGILILCMTNTAYAYLLADGQYHTGHVMDVGWLLSFLFVAVAARVPPSAERGRDSTDTNPLWPLLMPYAPAGLVAGVTATSIAAGSQPDRFMVLSLITLSVLVLIRYSLTIIEQKQVESELRAVARQLNEAQELTHIGSWAQDLKTSRLLWSDELYRIMAMDPRAGAPTLGTLREMVHPKDKSIFDAAVETITHGGSIDLQYRVIVNDGSIRWVHSRSSPAVGDAQNGPHGTLEDVTERKKTEESLRFQAGLLDAVAHAVIATDPQGVIIYWNSAAERLYGWRAKEILGQPIVTIISPEAIDSAAEIMRELTTGESWSGEFWMCRRDGSRFPAAVTTTAAFDDSGALVAVIGTSSDVSDRRQAEDHLRASEERFRQLVEAAPLAIVEVDVSGHATLCNPAAESAFAGGSPGDAPLDLREHPVLSELFTRVTGGEQIAGERISGSEGEKGQVQLEVSAGALRNGAGDVTGAILLAADVTFRKSLENQLLQAQKLEAVGRLAGGVAHDFNNLLTIVLNYSVLLLDLVDEDAEVRSGLEAIRTAAERAAALTSRLLTFSRKRVATRTVLDLNEAVLSVHELLSRTLGKDISLEARTDPAAGYATIERSEFDQLVLNLAVNARDAMPAGGSLLIATSRVVIDGGDAETWGGVPRGEYAVLTVADTGLGMDAETAAACFEPFFTTKPQGKGTGLGLASVYGIVAGVNGHVQVQSRPGEGTEFTVIIPAVATPGVLESGGVGPASSSDNRSRSVLLVEDEEEVRSLTSDILTHAGYHVLTASNGVEALAVVDDELGMVDVLVTDVVMPEMGGIDLAQKLARSHPDLEVVFISGFTDRLLPELRLGEKPWLVEKPFQADALVRTVREALRARELRSGAASTTQFRPALDAAAASRS
ncbi:MAG TPA: PAS domain S-box protein [Acidimicrobiales bacterium]|nr:PAS domain S-box protein [Acidimicrobiales bacterium]